MLFFILSCFRKRVPGDKTAWDAILEYFGAINALQRYRRDCYVYHIDLLKCQAQGYHPEYSQVIELRRTIHNELGVIEDVNAVFCVFLDVEFQL